MTSVISWMDPLSLLRYKDRSAPLCPEGSGVMIPCYLRWGQSPLGTPWGILMLISRKDCVIFTLVSWHLALRGGDDKSGECGERERSPGRGVGVGCPESKGKACPNRAPGMGRNKATPTHFLLYILFPENYKAADVSDKETEKQRNT